MGIGPQTEQDGFFFLSSAYSSSSSDPFLHNMHRSNTHTHTPRDVCFGSGRKSGGIMNHNHHKRGCSTSFVCFALNAFSRQIGGGFRDRGEHETVSDAHSMTSIAMQFDVQFFATKFDLSAALHHGSCIRN